MGQNSVDLSNTIRRILPPDAKKVMDCLLGLLGDKKKEAVLVGGVVRDLLLNESIKDADFMLEHPAALVVKELGRILDGTVVSHDRFLTFTVQLSSGTHFDFVTARTETYSAPAKLPEVQPATFENDLKRRDFTINAMAVWLTPEKFGQLLDPFNGREDIHAKNIRILHEKSFIDDPTRIFRAARFAGRLDFQMESKTEALILSAINANIPSLLSPARIRHELELILIENTPLKALGILERWNALDFIAKGWKVLPEHRGLFESSSLKVPTNLLSQRLAWWLCPWGKEAAQKSMENLGFGKAIKKEVTQYLKSLVSDDNHLTRSGSG